jgi:hypothetical protein
VRLRESRVSCVTGTLALDRDSLNPEIYLSSAGGRQPNQRRADCSGKPFKPGLFFCYKFRRRLHSDTTRRRDERERDKPWIIPHWWHPALFQAQGTRSPDRHGIMSFPFSRERRLSFLHSHDMIDDLLRRRDLDKFGILTTHDPFRRFRP